MKRFAVYRRLFSYLKPHSTQVALAYGSMFTMTVISLFIPQIIKRAIDNGIEQGSASALYISGLIILGISFATGIVGFASFFFSSWLTHAVAYDLRNDYYAALQRLPFAFHDTTETGDLMSRATSDIGETERFVGVGLADLTAAIMLISGAIVAMLIEDWRLALVGLIPIPILAFATIRFGNTVRPLFKTIQEQIGTLSNTMQQSLTGIQVVKAFAREQHELDKFDAENDEWFNRRLRLIKTWAANWPFFTFLVSVSIFLLLWFGGPRAADVNGGLTVGSLFALISYVLMLQAPVQRLGFLTNLASNASATGARIFEIMDEENRIADRPDAQRVTTLAGAVRFDNVSFSYRDGRQVLDSVSFSAEPGDKVALIGPTGSGKSTVTNLIPRFYEAQAGQVLLDGTDVRDLQMATLRQHVGIVQQEPFLFTSTIAENIAYGWPDAPRDQIIEAAKAAQAHDFILRFPEGYDTFVGERGVTLSGGQKQRLAIARALLVDPRILILDDSTSSVDTETEYLIQTALQNLMRGRTTFIIAQRLLTLKHADQILVLDKGRIVERGTHTSLLEQNGLYRDIYDLQLKDQEAARVAA